MDSSRFEQYARFAAIAFLAIGCFMVVQPFLGAILFAGVLCFSTWPAFTRLREKVKGRSWLAALLIVLLMVVALVVPIALAGQSLVVHSAQVVEIARGFLEQGSLMELPGFIRGLPFIGGWLNEYWTGLMASKGELVELGKRLADPAKAMALAAGAAVGHGLIQVLIALFVAYFFYRDGDNIKSLLSEGMRRLAGPEQGEQLISTAQNAVRGVVYGLIGTAFAQALVAVIGFLIAGVPGALLLGALTFFLSLIPMGPVLAWGGAAAWLYFNGETGWAIFMVIYGVGVISSVDNFVKPILMSRAGGLGMLLVVLGVFGGAVAFGFIGLFVGPALLAIGWSVLKTWLGAPKLAGFDDTK